MNNFLNKDEFVTHEMRSARNSILKILNKKSPDFAANVLLWIYTDVLLNHYAFEDVMKFAEGVKDVIEITARQHFKKEN